MSGFGMRAEALGDILYDLHKREEGEGMGDMLLEWAKERMYGLMTEDHLPHFRELWNKLNENGHVSRDTAFYYGDGDQYVWAEQLDENTKLIINHDVVTCADDNTVIYLLKQYDFNNEDAEKLLFEFRVFTAFEEEVKRQNVWNDRRDYDKVSLQTYRDKGFDFGYGDGRDNTHVLKFKYTHRGANVEKAHWTESRIKRELRELKRFNEMFEQEKDWHDEN